MCENEIHTSKDACNVKYKGGDGNFKLYHFIFTQETTRKKHLNFLCH